MKLCIKCNEPVSTTKHKSQKYCSRKCYIASSTKKIGVCQHCDKEFKYYASRPTANYCSNRCYWDASADRLRSYVKPTGQDHWNWKGGVIKGRKERNHKIYKDWRKAVFERDNYTCNHCGKRGGWLEADHIKAWIDYPELRYEVDNGRTLCKPCHHKRTSEQFKGRGKYATV